MKIVKYWKITVSGKKKECEETFALIKSICDLEVEEFEVEEDKFDRWEPWVVPC